MAPMPSRRSSRISSKKEAPPPPASPPPPAIKKRATAKKAQNARPIKAQAPAEPASKAPRSKKAPPPAKRAATPPAKSAAKIGKKKPASKSKAPAAAPADPTGAAKGLRREWHWTSSDARSNTAAGDAAQYVVSQTDGVWHCTCKGWRFLGQAKKAAGQSCHHIRAAKGFGEYENVGPLPPDAEYEIASKKPKSAPRAKAGGAGGSDLSSLPPAGLPSGGEDAIAASTEIFATMTIDQIKHQLREQNQLLKGTKAELVERAVDCRVWGLLPRCPECGGGKLKVSYHNGSDPSGGQTFKCPGFYDEDHYHFCSFSSTDVKRPAWVDQPMAAKKATSAKPMPVD